MKVRVATTADIPDITRLIQKQAGRDGVTPPASQSLQETLHTLLCRDSTTYVVAENEGERVKDAMQLDFRLTTWEAAPYVFIEDFFVEEQHRGQGIGAGSILSRN